MFEKEAEEYGLENYRNYDDYPYALTDEKQITKAFQKGAEFGYNKANEWHYVKDGDLPKENKICLLYFGSRFNPITGWIKDGIWYFEDDRKNGVWQSNVIAWKEIELPKEIKEND